MLECTLGVVKNIGKILFVSTDLPVFTELNQSCKELNNLSANSQYNCTGTIHFFEKKIANQEFIIKTDYGGKWNAYFCSTYF